MNDEQRMREQFEALRLPPDEWSQEVRDRLFKWDGRNYLNGKIDSEWHGFQDGYRARDAEVQALRKLVDHAKRIFQNAEVRSGYCVCGETPERHDLYADACQYTDQGQREAELWLKREAALRGEEGKF